VFVLEVRGFRVGRRTPGVGREDGGIRCGAQQDAAVRSFLFDDVVAVDRAVDGHVLGLFLHELHRRRSGPSGARRAATRRWPASRRSRVTGASPSQTTIARVCWLLGSFRFLLAAGGSVSDNPPQRRDGVVRNTETKGQERWVGCGGVGGVGKEGGERRREGVEEEEEEQKRRREKQQGRQSRARSRKSPGQRPDEIGAVRRALRRRLGCAAWCGIRRAAAARLIKPG
jgi:hypothetical protein